MEKWCYFSQLPLSFPAANFVFCNTFDKYFDIFFTYHCGGTGIDTTVPTNTVQVPNTTGTVTDSGSVNNGFLGAISGYIYRSGKL